MQLIVKCLVFPVLTTVDVLPCFVSTHIYTFQIKDSSVIRVGDCGCRGGARRCVTVYQKANQNIF